MLRIKARHVAAAVALLSLAPAAANAQTQSEAVVVTGRAPEQTRQFVSNVAIPAGVVDQLARWDRTLCTSIAGLPARQGQFIADRIGQRAAALGLQPGEPGCQPNVTIVVARDADAAAQRMNQETPWLFARGESNITTLDEAAFTSFLQSDRPVRWWHVAQRKTSEGMQLSGDTAMGGLSNAPVARSSGSRLRNDTREDLTRVVIIVDAERVGSVQLASLADYIAMVTLAQINPSAAPSGQPSILNVFDGGAATEMTGFDTAYLDGLYRVDRLGDNIQQQRDIARRMETGSGA
jgi:hypothetical protein